MWTETEKAFWILENGPPDHVYIFERNGDMIYQRAALGPSGKIAPWISKERVLVSSMLTGKKYNTAVLDEFNDIGTKIK